MTFRTLIISFAVGLLFVSNVATAEQKVVFIVESIKFGSGIGAELCQDTCESKSSKETIEELISSGWNIINSAPKEVLGYSSSHGTPGFNCTCVGTHFVLRKDDPAQPPKPDVPSKNEELLKKENELLKRENDLLKQENKNLKAQLKPKQKKK